MRRLTLPRAGAHDYVGLMRVKILALCAVLLLCRPVPAVTKPHVISFGKWTAVKWYVGNAGDKAVDLKVRALFVDSKLKEYTSGLPHDATDRLFVVRRMFRINDVLPQEPATTQRWEWQRGGWLMVDRVSGRVTQIALPEFDPYYSTGSWYRDYVAYCGVSDDGKKLFAVVAQLGRRKPILKKPLGEPDADEMPDSECPAPTWQRGPTRVTFEPDDEQKLTYAVRGHAVDIVSNDEESEGGD
jgi:hypothetical protein